MKNLSRFLTAALIAAALSHSSTARAGDVFGLDLGVHGGVAGVADGKSSLFVGGAQLRANLVWILGAEARVSYYTDRYDASQLGSVDVKNLPVQLSAMLHLPLGIYVLGGGTYNSVTLEGNGNLNGKVTSNKWSAHAGAGIDFKVSDHFLLNLDGRYVFLNVDPGNLPPPSSGEYKGDYWMATGGLIWKIF